MKNSWLKELSKVVEIDESNVQNYSCLFDLDFGADYIWFNESSYYNYDKEDDSKIVLSITFFLEKSNWIYLFLEKVKGTDTYKMGDFICLMDGDYYYFHNINKPVVPLSNT